MKTLQILTDRAKHAWRRLAFDESPLHEAIIHNDLDKTIDPRLQETIDGLGFTPLEIAQLLNRTDWLPRLTTPHTHRIKIARKGDSVAKAYSPQQFHDLFGIPYLSHLTFTSYDLLKIIIGQCPWICRFGILGMERDSQYEFYREKIFNAAVASTTVVWINETIGYGLFTNSDLDTGAFIGTYTGVVRPLSRRQPDQNAYCLHYPTRFWSWNIFVIDAGKGGNEIRFVNHSDNPNLDLECLYDRGILHFFLRAKHPIRRGAHLTFNYGEAFWRYRKSPSHCEFSEDSGRIFR